MRLYIVRLGNVRGKGNYVCGCCSKTCKLAYASRYKMSTLGGIPLQHARKLAKRRNGRVIRLLTHKESCLKLQATTLRKTSTDVMNQLWENSTVRDQVSKFLRDEADKLWPETVRKTCKCDAPVEWMQISGTRVKMDGKFMKRCSKCQRVLL